MSSVSAILRTRDLPDFAALVDLTGARKVGSSYVGHCPAHADGSPSLAVSYNATSRKALVHCRAGCAVEDVLAALDLDRGALSDVDQGNIRVTSSPAGPRGHIIGVPVSDPEDDAVRVRASTALATYVEAAARAFPGSAAAAYAAQRCGVDADTAARLGLGHDDGSVVLPEGLAIPDHADRLVVPFRTREGDVVGLQARALSERPIRWTGPRNPEDWSWSPLAFLRVDDAVPRGPLVVTEGPTDGLTVAGAGLDAVAIRGANLVNDATLDALAAAVSGRLVLVAEDDDPAGRTFTAAVLAGLAQRGHPAVRLPCPEGAGDVTDWRALDPAGFPHALRVSITSALEAPAETVGDVLDLDEPARSTSPAPAVEAAATTYDRRDTADGPVAERVVAEFLAGRYLMATGLGWQHWNGTRWADAPAALVGEAVRVALKTMCAADIAEADRDHRAAQDAAMAAEGDAGRQASAAATSRHSARLRSLRPFLSASKVKAVTGLVTGMLTRDGRDFDGWPYLLNTPSGVVDLTTGALQAHDPALLLTRITAAPYVPGAEHADWTRALEAVGPEVRAWLQRRFGQALSGFPPSDDVTPFLKGGGRNGKSTLVGPLVKALGTVDFGGYAYPVPARVLESNPSEHTTVLTDFRGARLAIVEELPNARWLDAQRLKHLSGDTITARRIGRDQITFPVTHSMFVSTNYLLQVAENDHGTWRRMALVNFTRTYGGSGPDDPAVDETLRPALIAGHEGRHEAILAWLVAGAVAWHHEGETMGVQPASVRADTEAWRTSSDPLERFLAEMTTVDPEGAVKSADLYFVYAEWARERNLKAWSDQTFGGRLDETALAQGGTIARGHFRLSSYRLYAPGGGLRPLPAGKVRAVRGLRFATPV